MGAPGLDSETGGSTNHNPGRADLPFCSLFSIPCLSVIPSEAFLSGAEGPASVLRLAPPRWSYLEAGAGSPSRSKCSTLCDLDPAKWSLKVSQEAPSGRLKLRESLKSRASSTGAPGNFLKQG